MKRWISGLLAGLTLFALSGCRSVFARDYYYETPYTVDAGMRSDSATEIRNYSMLKAALTNMISRHAEKSEFRFSDYNGNLSEDLAAACFEIKSDHPLGAYAVESLSYDTSYVVSYYMANIYVSYKRTAEELNEIVYTSDRKDFDSYVRKALDNFEPKLVLRCFSEDISDDYILSLVKRHCYDHPATTVTEPATEVTAFPADGANCIYEIRFRYQLNHQSNTLMARMLQERVQAAADAMEESEQAKLALESAAFLSERCAGAGSGPYADTAYGALINHNADSKGLALAYRAMCDALGIECTVVEGSYGSMETQPHFWNIIGLEGEHYHVDVSGLAEDPAAWFLQSDNALWGRCIWETADYPACSGTLTYAEVAGIPESSEETAGEGDAETQQTSAEQRPPEDQAPEDVPTPPDETPESGEGSVDQEPDDAPAGGEEPGQETITAPAETPEPDSTAAPADETTLPEPAPEGGEELLQETAEEAEKIP